MKNTHSGFYIILLKLKKRVEPFPHNNLILLISTIIIVMKNNQLSRYDLLTSSFQHK